MSTLLEMSISKTFAHLLWVCEVIEESVLVPSDALLYVGFGVRETVGLSGLATENPVQQRSVHQHPALKDVHV